MGCNSSLPEPDLFKPGRIERREHSYYDGCFQFESTTAWTEMCHMFADEIDCEGIGHADVISSGNQTLTGRDNFASSALAKAYYHTFAYSLIPKVLDLYDPDPWFSSTRDHLVIDGYLEHLDPVLDINEVYRSRHPRWPTELFHPCALERRSA